MTKTSNTALFFGEHVLRGMLPPSFARHLVSEIRAYYDSDEGRAAFEEWLKQRKYTEDA